MNFNVNFNYPIEMLESAIEKRQESWIKLYKDYLYNFEDAEQMDWLELGDTYPEAKEIIMKWFIGLID